ncbi:hypothetical protein [Xanthovirga aplysinae]|uniref:hypothetical protein n=1 Tax=Xanthovirga aplysinae TaxID=2529853 RepID=UPI0012BB5823|nr:hypothetical protein [Xanthovirga aplysinae]MTI32476.1 hypothetical protein [Xanthovirga aplysinae]
MAKSNPELIAAIRRAAKRIATEDQYQWGHMGSCNCGYLAQEITQLSRAEIHDYATRKYGDWTTQSDAYCPNSGYPMDLLISKLLEAGMEIEDIKHLERLSNPKILAHLPASKKHLRYNAKEDVMIYMSAWAHKLQLEWEEKAEQLVKLKAPVKSSDILDNSR